MCKYHAVDAFALYNRIDMEVDKADITLLFGQNMCSHAKPLRNVQTVFATISGESSFFEVYAHKVAWAKAKTKKNQNWVSNLL